MRFIDADLLFDSTFPLYRKLSDKDFGKLNKWLKEFPTVEIVGDTESSPWVILENGAVECDRCGLWMMGTQSTYLFCPKCSKMHYGTVEKSKTETEA